MSVCVHANISYLEYKLRRQPFSHLMHLLGGNPESNTIFLEGIVIIFWVYQWAGIMESGRQRWWVGELRWGKRGAHWLTKMAHIMDEYILWCKFIPSPFVHMLYLKQEPKTHFIVYVFRQGSFLKSKVHVRL